jgi:protein-S-isoprenylcysteine O-methyltransferase Ste14
MESRSRRRSRRSRWTPALLLAVVALTSLAVAGPAVAKPLSHAPSAALSTTGAIAVIAIAVCAALALTRLASFSVRRAPRAHAEIGKLKAAPRDSGHRVAA